jgi:hypothetical protein
VDTGSQNSSLEELPITVKNPERLCLVVEAVVDRHIQIFQWLQDVFVVAEKSCFLEGQRMLANAITERLGMVGGSLMELTPGSTRPLAQTVSHAGLATVRRYTFPMPAA